MSVSWDAPSRNTIKTAPQLTASAVISRDSEGSKDRILIVTDRFASSLIPSNYMCPMYHLKNSWLEGPSPSLLGMPMDAIFSDALAVRFREGIPPEIQRIETQNDAIFEAEDYIFMHLHPT